MFDEQVAPRLRQVGGRGRVIVHHKINLFGKGESDIEADGARPDRARPHPRGRHHRLRRHDQLPDQPPRGTTEDEARRAIEPTLATIRERFGDLVVGEGTVDVVEAVVALLARTADHPGDRRVVHRRPDRPPDHRGSPASARSIPAGSSATPTRPRSTSWASPPR